MFEKLKNKFKIKELFKSEKKHYKRTNQKIFTHTYNFPITYLHVDIIFMINLISTYNQ